MTVPSSVKTQLRAILNKDNKADCIALLWSEALENNIESYELDGQTFKVVYCSSQLAMREQLIEHNGSERLVLLSPFDGAKLANDILARLWKQEPQQISPWRTLKELLRVEMIDPRLTKPDYKWIAESLVSRYEHYQDKISFGVVIDQENAWKALAIGLLHYEEETVDLHSLYKWSMALDDNRIIDELSDDVRHHLVDWLKPGLPECAGLLSLLLNQGHASHLLAVGLVCSVMYHKEVISYDVVTEQMVLQARIRFSERFLDGESIPESALVLLAEHAVSYVEKTLQDTNNKVLNACFSYAEQVLASLDLMPATIYSHLLPASYNLRLDVLSEALKPVVAAKSLSRAKVALQSLINHKMAGEQVDRAEMAIRLYEWLQNHKVSDKELNTLITDYIEHGSFVDWARSKIWSGDVHECLSVDYEKLSKKVSKQREILNQQFADHLPDIAQGCHLNDGILAVEDALVKLVTPLAKQKCVLLLVLDGMSQAVYREWTKDLINNDWVEIQEINQKPACLIATLPTITKASRCSLLSGRICEGVAADEKKAFQAHVSLKQVSSPKFPPKLFHKNDLQHTASGGLTSNVRAVIAGAQHRIVATVINVVDDQLSSNAQLSVNWDMDSVSILQQVLEAAREAERVVIVTSDHGHVLNHDMQAKKPGDEGERYKLDINSVNKGEVAVNGKRVLTQSKQVVLPWSEKIRYAASKMGYHGGASLQEVIIPLGIFMGESDAVIPENWQEVSRYIPDWWQVNHDTLQSFDTRSNSVATSKKVTQDSLNTLGVTLDLFDSVNEEDTVFSDWLSGFLTSPVYQQVKTRAGRAIKDESLLELLSLLDNNNGHVMTAMIIQELRIPRMRIRGFLAGAQKLLNIDGYPVLSVDRQSDTVKLNIESLKKQFEL